MSITCVYLVTVCFSSPVFMSITAHPLPTATHRSPSYIWILSIFPPLSLGLDSVFSLSATLICQMTLSVLSFNVTTSFSKSTTAYRSELSSTIVLWRTTVSFVWFVGRADICVFVEPPPPPSGEAQLAVNGRTKRNPIAIITI